MFNLGFPEMIVICAAGLLLFGPKRLPELAKSLGKGIRDFKKALNEEEEKTPPPVESLPPEHTAARPGPNKAASPVVTDDESRNKT